MADVIFPGQTPSGVLGRSKLPGNLDLIIWKGDAQNYRIKLTDSDGNPVDLTGKSAQATIRSDFESTPAYDFICEIQNSNEVLLYLPSAVSHSIPPGDYLWNFQVTDDATGDVRTYLAGDVTVDAEVD